MRRKLQRWLWLAAACVALASCRRETAETGEFAGKPAAPARGEVSGQVTLEGETDHSGALVFLGGTGYSAYTDGEGRFQIVDVRPGTYVVTAQHEGYVKKRLDEIVVSPTAPGVQKFELIPAQLERRSVATEIIDKALGSIAGVARYADKDNHANITIRVVDTVFSTVTDESGAFSLNNLAPGSYALSISSPGYATEVVSAQVKAGDVTDVNPGESGAQVVTLQPVVQASESGRSVRGRVEMVDAAGAQVAGYKDVLVSLEGTGHVASVDEEGRFAIDGVAPGTYSVLAKAAGFQQAEKATVNLEDASVATVDLRLTELQTTTSETGAVQGRVVLERGEAPTGVQVGLAGTELVSLTGTSGDFKIANVPAGVYTLVAAYTGYRKAEVPDLSVEKDKTTDAGEILLKRAIEPPTVLMTDPPNNQVDVAIRKVVPVSIRFSKKMEPQSTVSAVSISPPVEYKAYIGKENSQSDYDLLYLELQGTGARALDFQRTYRITIADSATDFEGEQMAAPYAFSFRTGKAQIIGTDPANGATNVLPSQIGAPLRIYFNARVRHDSLTGQTIRVMPEEGQSLSVYCQDDPETGWTTAFLSKSWQPDTRYTITVGARARLSDSKSGIANLPYRFTFTTAKGQDIGRTRTMQEQSKIRGRK